MAGGRQQAIASGQFMFLFLIFMTRSECKVEYVGNTIMITALTIWSFVIRNLI